MKKFENLVASTFIFLLATVVLVTGCEKNESGPDTPENLVYDPESKTSFNVGIQNELHSLVRALAKESREIQILEAAFTDLKDSKGSFKAIAARYKVGNEVTNLIVPVIGHELRPGDPAGTARYAPAECEMKCTSAWGCSECTQEVIERCKKQTCTCTSGSGGCSSKITFL